MRQSQSGKDDHLRCRAATLTNHHHPLSNTKLSYYQIITLPRSSTLYCSWDITQLTKRGFSPPVLVAHPIYVPQTCTGSERSEPLNLSWHLLKRLERRNEPRSVARGFDPTSRTERVGRPAMVTRCRRFFLDWTERVGRGEERLRLQTTKPS